MGSFSCFNKSRPVRHPLPPANNTSRPPTAAIGSLGTKNNFGAESQALRSIQKIPTDKLYYSNQLNLSENQYDLLRSAFAAREFTLGGLLRVYRATNFAHAINVCPNRARVAQLNINTEEYVNNAIRMQNNQAQFSKKIIKKVDDKQIALNNPVLNESYNALKQSAGILDNGERLLALIKNKDALFFSETVNIDLATATSFINECLEIEEGIAPGQKSKQYDNDTGTTTRSFLEHLSDCYGRKEALKSQLPKIDKNLEELKKNKNLDKDLLKIIEGAVKTFKLGLVNMNHPPRMAILEQFAPSYRPVAYVEAGKSSDLRTLYWDHKSILNDKTDKEIETILNKLQAIPVILA